MKTSDRLVVDASVLVDSLVSAGDVGYRARRAMQEHRWCAPEHMRMEVFNSIRRWVRARKVPADTGRRAIRHLATITIETVPAGLLFDRMWELRDNLTAYDGAYVAAAEYLDAPLLTSDHRLAAAPGLRCEVRFP